MGNSTKPHCLHRRRAKLSAPAISVPRNDTESRIAALWTDLLGVLVTDVNADFFDMGGHSLLAGRLLWEVQRTFGIALSLPTFLNNGTTVAKIAALLDAEGARATDEAEPGLLRPSLGRRRCTSSSLTSFRR